MFKHILILILLYQALTQTCFGVSSQSESVCSGGGTCVAQDLCACYSGRAGTNCQITAAPTCRFFGPPQPLVTNYPPSLDRFNTFFANDTLNIQVNMPLVRKRLGIVISINNSPDPACRYPGTYFVDNLNQTGDCRNEFVASIPFSVAINCGWNVTQIFDPTGNVTQQIFSGNVFVTYLEDIDAGDKQRALRAVRSGLPILIRFIISMNETMVPIIGGGEVLSALQNVLFVLGTPLKQKKYFGSFQEPVAAVPNSGLLTFVTNVPFPFILLPQTGSVIQVPTGLTTQGIQLIPSQTYCNATDVECFQTWSVPLGIEGACSFTGTYVFNFTIGCRAQPCNITFPNPFQFNFTVVGTDFCAQFQLNVGLTGTLLAFRNDNFTVLSDNYNSGDLIFLRATVSSPRAQILNTRVKRVVVINSNNLVLYDNTITPAGDAREFTILPSTASTNANFRFRLSFLNLPTIPTNLTIQTIVRVQYVSLADDYTFHSVQEQDVIFEDRIEPKSQKDDLTFSKEINLGNLTEIKESCSASLASLFLLMILFLFV